jgi:hypothetical protein
VGLRHVEGKVDSGYGGGNLRERERLENLGLLGLSYIIKVYRQETNCERLHRIHLAENKEK